MIELNEVIRVGSGPVCQHPCNEGKCGPETEMQGGDYVNVGVMLPQDKEHQRHQCLYISAQGAHSFHCLSSSFMKKSNFPTVT